MNFQEIIDMMGKGYRLYPDYDPPFLFDAQQYHKDLEKHIVDKEIVTKVKYSSLVKWGSTEFMCLVM